MADDDVDSMDGLGGGSGGTDKKLASSMREVGQQTDKLTTGANAYAKAITSAFAQGVTGAKSFDAVLSSLGQRISSLSLNLALKPLTNLLGTGLEKLIGGITGAQPFAQGGVIN